MVISSESDRRISSGTASAAELMAGSLQAYDKAEIVGMKTFGTAVAQMPFMLTEETAIYLTSARYYTPKGECIDKKGIEPDVKIDMPDDFLVKHRLRRREAEVFDFREALACARMKQSARFVS